MEHFDRRLEILSLKEASQFTSLSESYLRRHSVGNLEPKIPYKKLGGRIKFFYSDLVNVIQGLPDQVPDFKALDEEIRQTRLGNIPA